MTGAPPAPDAAARLNRIFFGLAVALLGIAMLSDPRERFGIYLPDGWWPVFVILFGLARLLAPGEKDGRPRSRRTGAWFVGVGLWGLISETRIFGFGYSTSWPLLVILAGVAIVWRAMEQPASTGPP